jgi:cell division septum initiation protein DivIVA
MEKMDVLESKMEKIDVLETKIDALENTIQKLVTENSDLRKQVAQRDEVIEQLSDRVNRLDQASRSTSLRILGLPINPSTPAAEVPNIVFREILSPVFEAAKTNGDAPPDVRITPYFAIANCFALPPKKNSTSCPVILKLSSESLRSLVFKYKKDTLPTITDPSTNRVRPRFSIYEDLSPANFSQFRSFADDYRVKSVWSFSGQIRFKTHDSDTVHKATSLASTVDSLIKKARPQRMSQ